MNDHDLPDERPLDDHTRARMRAELMAATATAEQRRPSWLVPAAASVALLAVVGTSAAVLAGGSESSGGDPAGPAGGATPTPAPSAPGGDEPERGEVTEEPGEPSGLPSRVPGAEGVEPWQDQPPSSCADDVPAFLSGAAEAASIDYADASASLWSNGTKWVVCDTWAADADGGPTTLIGGRRLDAPVSKQTFRLSQNYSMIDNDAAQFFAGGPSIPGVTAITYTFPDGHVAEAEIDDQMWLMTYVASDSPVTEGLQGPVTVTVTREGDAPEEYVLRGVRDTCAQLNHGC